MSQLFDAQWTALLPPIEELFSPRVELKELLGT